MNLYVLKNFADDVWDISGNFGKFDAELKIDNGRFYAENGCVEVKSQTEKFDDGVCVRCGKVKNISGSEVTLNALSSVFTLDGGEYKVYSQYNGWQNESQGAWQPLVTGVCASSESVRNARGAAPFAVLWNEQNNRGIAFHLSAYSNWEINITKKYGLSNTSYVEVKLGVSNNGLAARLSPGEELELPKIIYYSVSNPVDFDCWRLHAYLNKKYPRREMPVIYNTWLYKFDRFTYDDILKQIDKACDLGVEYFVVDAGWFGNGENWSVTRGDWEENKNFGFGGRMKEAAEAVRARGMKFGFWLEPECASPGSNIVKEHPEYFLKTRGDYFIDFSKSEATDYIFNKTCELIDSFGAKFIKFDFNADLEIDINNCGFIKYFNGHKKYIKMLRKRYPDLYIENCASGGMRMSLRDGALYDSFWLSDNQSPYESMRIFKDTMRRMPPQWIECWATVTSVENIAPVYGSFEFCDKLISTNDATWSDVRGVNLSWLFGLFAGGPIGISCDLTSLSDSVFCSMKKHIADFKKNREFWKSAVCHILSDTESVTALEFRNEDFSRIELVVFVKKAIQDNICLYPVVNENLAYNADGIKKCAAEIFEDGIDFKISESVSVQTLSLVSIH